MTPVAAFFVGYYAQPTELLESAVELLKAQARIIQLEPPTPQESRQAVFGTNRRRRTDHLLGHSQDTPQFP